MNFRKKDKKRNFKFYEKGDENDSDQQHMLSATENKPPLRNKDSKMKTFIRRKHVLSPATRGKYFSAMDSKSESSQSDEEEETFDRFKERITINVGGFKHETFRSTLRNFPDTRLAWIAENNSNNYDGYDPVKKEYFFDRHPGVFAQILNYYRTGRLHTPVDVCGPLFEEELQFWGLDEQQMEPCCWAKYTEHRDAQENLKVFDDFVNNDEDTVNMLQSDDTIEPSPLSIHLQPSLKRFKLPLFKTRGWKTFKLKTWMLFEDPRSSVWAKAMVFVSLSFIILSVLSLCFNSVITLAKREDKDVLLFERLLLVLDVICCTWFTMEFLLRLIACPDKAKFFMSLTNWIDLITVIPYYVLFIFSWSQQNSTIEALEIVSATRLMRLFRFFRLSTGLQILKHTMIASSKELLLLLLLMMIPVAIFSTIVYHCERKVSGTEFRTIPESFWWAIITITTVGYGDMSPTTTLGKVFGAFCATMSVLILALPVSIIGNNFSLFYSYAQARLKLPKKEHHVLVGAANVLVAEASQAMTSPDLDEEPGSRRMSEAEARKSLGLIDANITVSKRYRRERLSLFAGGMVRPPTKPSRAKSMGNALSVNSNPSGDEDDDKDIDGDEKPSLIRNGIITRHEPINQSNATQITDAGSLSENENDENDDNCSDAGNKSKEFGQHDNSGGNSPNLPSLNGGIPSLKPPSGKKRHLLPPHKVHPTITLTSDDKEKYSAEKEQLSSESMESIPLTLRKPQIMPISYNLQPLNGHISTPPTNRSSKANSPKLSASPKLSPANKQNGRVYMETVAEVTVDSPRTDKGSNENIANDQNFTRSQNHLDVPEAGDSIPQKTSPGSYGSTEVLDES